MPGERRVLTSDEEAVRAIESAYDAAWNAGDAAGASRLFVEDAVIINPFGEVSAGRGEVERLLRDVLAGRGRGSTHASNILSVRFVARDVAVVDGEAVISSFGAGPSPLRHRFTDVLVCRDGTWRFSQVRAYMFMAPQPGGGTDQA